MLHNRLLLVILVDCEKIVAAGMVCRSAYEILSVLITLFFDRESKVEPLMGEEEV